MEQIYKLNIVKSRSYIARILNERSRFYASTQHMFCTV